MSELRETVRWLIYGQVQGVGYRWFVLKRAQELGITGQATNLPDGRVEVVGQGTREKLDAFEQSLGEGPRFAYVDSVEKNDVPHETIRFKSFYIN